MMERGHTHRDTTPGDTPTRTRRQRIILIVEILAMLAIVLGVFLALILRGPGPGDTPWSRAALERAVVRGDVARVRELVEKGVDVKAVQATEWGVSLLEYAISNEDSAIVQILLEAGADPNDSTSYSPSPLHVAIRNSDATSVQLLVDHGAVLTGDPRYGPGSALTMAIEYADIETIEILLEAGVSPSWTGSSQSHLAMALDLGRTELIPLLLKHGADLEELGHQQASELLLDAIDADDWEFLNALLEGEMSRGVAPGHSSLLTYLAARGDADMVARVIEHGAAVDAIDKNGDTALIVAVKRSQFENAQALLQYGADVNAKGANGRTALMHLGQSTPVSIVHLLMQAGADPTIKWIDGRTVLEHIRENCPSHVAEIVQTMHDAANSDEQPEISNEGSPTPGD